MPFIRDYTDSSAVNYPLSLWIVALITLNHPNRTGIIHLNGYASAESYDLGEDFIAQEAFVFNDVDIYDQYLRFQFESPNTGGIFSFHDYIETALIALGFTEIQESSAQPVFLEIGGESDSKVNIGFSRALNSTSSPGVTIKVNGTPATISSAGTGSYFPPELVIVPPYIGYFILSSPVGPTDVVTWSYDGGFDFGGIGALNDSALLTVRKFDEFAVDNTVGEYLQFDRDSNSGQLITLGVF